MNLKTAIIQFLANEFHMEAKSISEDTSFESDLGLTPEQISELLRNIQDALNITLPEDQTSITTVGQLMEAVETEGSDEPV